MFTFFDELPEFLPKDAQFYYNILIVCIEVSQEYWNEYFPKDINETWYLQDITSSRPKAYHFYIEDDIDEDYDYEIYCIPHTVIAVEQDKQIQCYNMIDFDTDDPWEID